MLRLKKISSNGLKARAWFEPETELWMVQPEGCVYFTDEETMQTLNITHEEYYNAIKGTRTLPHPLDEGYCWKNKEEAEMVASNINQLLEQK